MYLSATGLVINLNFNYNNLIWIAKIQIIFLCSKLFWFARLAEGKDLDNPIKWSIFALGKIRGDSPASTFDWSGVLEGDSVFLGCFAEELCHSACLKRFWIDVCTPARSTLTIADWWDTRSPFSSSKVLWWRCVAPYPLSAIGMNSDKERCYEDVVFWYGWSLGGF